MQLRIGVTVATAYHWLVDNPDVAAAIATILLTVFAAIQIGLEVARRKDRARSAAIEAEGPAWLARRSLEVAMHKASSADTCFGWAAGIGAEPLDRVEEQMLGTLRLSCAAGGKHAEAARTAFQAFIGFADRVNRLAAFPASGVTSYGSPTHSGADKVQAIQLFGEAFDHADSAVAALAQIAPRQIHEGPLPTRAEVKLIAAAGPTPP